MAGQKVRRGRGFLALFSASYGVEPLENRVLLSVSGAPLAGPFNVVGTHWEYAGTDADGNTNTLIETAAGPTTFNGNACYDIQVGPTGSSHIYEGLDAAGDFVAYGGVTTLKTDTRTDTDVPTDIGLPAQLNAGTPFTTTYTDNGTDVSTTTGTTTDTETDTDTTTLLSDTASPITVPAGTYDAYQIHESYTSVTPNGDGTTTTDTTSSDTWSAPDVGTVKVIDYDDTGAVNATFVLSVFKNVNSKLAFRQPPLDAGVGATIKPPVTVEIDDAAGNVQTGASGSVTLSLTPAAGATGTLSGTLTEPAVNGVATFSDLSINAAGDYTMTATDVSNAPAMPASSPAFKITDGQLVFIKAPQDGAAGTKLNPGVIVELQDAKKNIITKEDGTVVTLATIGVTGGASLTGNTAVLTGGKATFPALVFKDGGLYTLQASDATGDTAAVSAPFKITGEHLAFKGVPKTLDAGGELKCSILVENSKNQVVTDNTDVIGFSSSGLPATPYTAAAGVAAVQYTYDSSVPAGTYTLTATDSTSPGITVATATLKLLGDHLVFKGVPKTLDAGSELQCKILVEDSKNKVVTDNMDAIGFSSSGLPAIPYTAAAGVVAVQYTYDSSVPAGTYTLTATDASAPAISSATTTLKLLGDHLVFKGVPKTLDTGSDLKCKILVENSKNKIVTDNADAIGFSSSGLPATPYTAAAGEVDVDYNYDSSVPAGTITLTATDSSAPAIASATTTFKLLGDHLVFSGLPKSVHAGSDLKFRILVEDSKNEVVTDNTDSIGFSSSGLPAVPYTAEAGVVDVDYTYDSSVSAGTYTLTATDASAPAIASATAPIGILQ